MNRDDHLQPQRQIQFLNWIHAYQFLDYNISYFETIQSEMYSVMIVRVHTESQMGMADVAILFSQEFKGKFICSANFRI